MANEMIILTILGWLFIRGAESLTVAKKIHTLLLWLHASGKCHPLGVRTNFTNAPPPTHPTHALNRPYLLHAYDAPPAPSSFVGRVREGVNSQRREDRHHL